MFKKAGKKTIVLVAVALAGMAAYITAMAQGVVPIIHPPAQFATLKGVTVPLPDLTQFVKSKSMAIQMGKALFWDMAVGGDGKTACASCHFHAGADNRVTNQLSPGLNGPNPTVYNPTRSGNVGGPNTTLVKQDFPFHVLFDPNDRNSAILFDTDDVASSQGVFPGEFDAALDVVPNAQADNCKNIADPRFQVRGHSTRRVEPRNTPTMINAVFNYRNFWDGRANNIFNGANPFGPRDVNAGVYVAALTTTTPTKMPISLINASTASQAVGPPLSGFEMSCANKTFPFLAKRILTRRALMGQNVDATDSVLGLNRYPDATSVGTGIKSTYLYMLQAAFANKYWQSTVPVVIDGVSFKQREANFALFFGLAIMMYESTLVSDDAPLDRFLTNTDPAAPSALTADELAGMAIFAGKGNCIACHHGPQLTSAGTPLLAAAQAHGLVERMIMAESSVAHYDSGFYNIGVRPTIEDLGVGGVDPVSGNPLSFTRQFQNAGFPPNGTDIQPDHFQVNPCTFDVDPCTLTTALNFREAIDGSFKTPTLRNVELTGPYFHNGSRASLEQVVEFYNRGGDSRSVGPNGDTTGLGSNPSNKDAEIMVLGLTAGEQAQLVAFLKRPLTDDRVRCEKAPFDHPGLKVSNGHVGSNLVTEFDPLTALSKDYTKTLPAIGKDGRCATYGPLRPFEDFLTDISGGA